MEHAFPGLGKKKADDNRVAELERKTGQQTLEIDFLQRVLQRVEEARMLQALNGTAPSTNKSTKKSNGNGHDSGADVSFDEGEPGRVLQATE